MAGDPSIQLLSSPLGSVVAYVPSYLLRLPPAIFITSMDCPRDTGHRTLLPRGTCQVFTYQRASPCYRLTWFSLCICTHLCPQCLYGVY